jgi:SsrA-binding protein
MSSDSSASRKTLATHRKAFRDYFIEDRFEAGIELLGTEVKSLRAGDVNLTGSFLRIVHGEARIFNMNIKAYTYGNQFNHEPDRVRRLLLHRREIARMKVQQEQKGFALIPLSVYFRRGLAKLEIGVCRGKQKVDKRDDVKKKSADREMERAVRRKRV